MQRYAAWKAADIRKAVREGRAPTPGPPGGEGVDTASADLPSPPGANDLPTPPSGGKPAVLPRSESDAGGPSAAPPPPRHAPGGAVVYCHDGHAPAVAGTIAKVNPPEGLGVTYVVALADQVVSAFEAQLAPALEAGAAVVVAADATADADADSPASGDYIVTGVDTTIWRPRYTLAPAAGGAAVTVDDSVLKSWPPPRGRAPKAPKDAPFAAAHAPAASEPSAPPPPPPPVVAAPAASAPVAAAPVAGQPSLKDMQDAIKAAKSAISSLQFEDVKTAVKYLTAALELCTNK